MNLLTYFNYEKTDIFSIYRLKPENKDDFLSNITSEFRQCYITNEMLEEKAKENMITKSKFLTEYILPSIGNIKSGDFGEMLSYFLVIEHYTINDFILIAPRKWQWKEDRNKASAFSDAVGFYCEDAKAPSENDFIVCVESKMKATQSNKHRIQEAIDGANKDRLSRLAKTLIWLEERYARDGDLTMRNFIERYSKPVGKKTYHKYYKAFAILDKTFEDCEISKTINNADGISIIIVTMEELKNIYENNLIRIIESV
jgi:hypothetical protein